MAKATEETSENLLLPTESAEAIKQNLRNVAEEIARVRDRTREEAESLERIRGMLDLKYLNDLLGTVERLESRVRQMERTPVTSEAKRWKNELDNEQRRLAKLWDAFKTQEDQLKSIERERDDILKGWKTFEKQMEGLGTPTQVRSRLAHLETQNQMLKNDTASATARLEDYVKLFTQEQERLAKLYKVYQDTAAKYQTLVKRTKPEKAATKPASKAAKVATPARAPAKAAPARKRRARRGKAARKAGPKAAPKARKGSRRALRTARRRSK